METGISIPERIRRGSSQLGWFIAPLFLLSALFWATVLGVIGTVSYDAITTPGSNTWPIILTAVACVIVAVPILTMFAPGLVPGIYLSLTQNVRMAARDPAYDDLADEVHRLAENAGIRPVRYIGIQRGELNAFAFGLFPSRMAIVLGDHLIQALADEPDQLRAVIGHEIGHIASGDTILSTMVMVCRDTFRIGIIGPLAFVAGLFGYSFMGAASTPTKSRQDGGVSLVFALFGLFFLLCTLVVWIVGWTVITMIDVLQCYHSRQREYMADRAGALLTSRADMIGALMCLESFRSDAQLPPPDPLGPLKIVNFSGRGLFGLFATHPTTERRITRLRAYDDLDS